MLIYPGDGLSLNPGAESPIQNTGCGEEGKRAKQYRSELSGVIPTSFTLAVDPVYFRSEDSLDEGIIDISNVASISILLRANLVALTSLDLLLIFFNRGLGTTYPLGTPDGTISGDLLLCEMKRSIFRYDQDLFGFCIHIPCPNAKFMQIYIMGNGVNTGSFVEISFARGYNIGSGFNSV